MKSLKQLRPAEEDLQIYTSGATNIFRYPELAEGEKASKLIGTLEQKEVLQEFVADVNSQTSRAKRGIQVYIGDESAGAVHEGLQRGHSQL